MQRRFQGARQLVRTRCAVAALNALEKRHHLLNRSAHGQACHALRIARATALNAARRHNPINHLKRRATCARPMKRYKFHNHSLIKSMNRLHCTTPAPLSPTLHTRKGDRQQASAPDRQENDRQMRHPPIDKPRKHAGYAAASEQLESCLFKSCLSGAVACCLSFFANRRF